MTRIRPGVTTRQILEEARAAMEPVFARTKFSKPAYEQAARTLVKTGGGVFSHTVGMAVHDVGGYQQPRLLLPPLAEAAALMTRMNGDIPVQWRGDVLKPGQVFSVDPQLWVREENLYLRYEDVVVVKDKGYENFTHFLPTELDEIEKLVTGNGLVQRFPPAPDVIPKSANE
jgi:Xaa-Pro aminopeptidase